MVGLRDVVSYFIDPNREGYTVPKTGVLAVLFVAGAYAIYEILGKLKVSIDARLAVAVSPFILLGSTLRVLVDSRIITGHLAVIFTSPNVYLFIGVFSVSMLAISVLLERKKVIAYHKLMFLVGLAAVAISIMPVRFVNFQGIWLSSAFIFPWLLFSLLFKKWRPENRGVLLFQMFDANTTAVTLQFFGAATGFGYYEQHVLPTLLMDMFGPFSFVIVKAAVIITVLLLIDRFSDDKNFNNYVKLMVGILGAATGGRDFLRLAAFV